jgi:hypothetical protein
MVNGRSDGTVVDVRVGSRVGVGGMAVSVETMDLVGAEVAGGGGVWVDYTGAGAAGD